MCLGKFLYSIRILQFYKNCINLCILFDIDSYFDMHTKGLVYLLLDLGKYQILEDCMIQCNILPKGDQQSGLQDHKYLELDC